MAEGTIIRALSGFYYVQCGEKLITCKARGKFRINGVAPLVGDHVICDIAENGFGTVTQVLERKNSFIRPAVSNIDTLVFVAANTNPVTDPFLIDRVSVITEKCGCELIIAVNKIDLDSADNLRAIYEKTPYRIIFTSAETGEGINELRQALKGKISAFTGNSGVGKSSILNAINPQIAAQTDEVSMRLGRGKHTTRHVELFAVDEDTFIADTPGFASFEIEMIEKITKEELQYLFADFSDYVGECRFADCAHIKEPDCTVRNAVKNGDIAMSRYESYKKLYDLTSKRKPWE